MDSISHSCFSYLCCRGSGAAPNPRAGLLAAVIALLPDLDFLLGPFLSDVSRFAFHRGPSHSLFMALATGLLLGSLFFRRLGLPWWRAALLVGLAWFSHLVLDMCTGFGVALWWPFSHARVSFDLLFVVDPLASLPLIAAFIWDLRSNWQAAGARRGIALTGLLLWAVYAMISYGIRSKITGDFRVKLQEHGHQVREIHSEPTPFNNQLWYLCAKTERGFVITYRSIWDGRHWERWRELPRIQQPLSTFSGHPLPDKMEVVLKDWFTCQVPDDNQLDVIDLRLGKRYGWEDDDAPFLFIYHLWQGESGELHWSMNKPGSHYDYGRLENLFRRVTGHIPAVRLKPNTMLKRFDSEEGL